MKIGDRVIVKQDASQYYSDLTLDRKGTIIDIVDNHSYNVQWDAPRPDDIRWKWISIWFDVLKSTDKFKLGDRVCFVYENKPYFGEVIRTNSDDSTVDIRWEDKNIPWIVGSDRIQKHLSVCSNIFTLADRPEGYGIKEPVPEIAESIVISATIDPSPAEKIDYFGAIRDIVRSQ